MRCTLLDCCGWKPVFSGLMIRSVKRCQKGLKNKSLTSNSIFLASRFSLQTSMPRLKIIFG